MQPDFWTNYSALCAAHGEAPVDCAAQLGFSAASVAHWKGGAKPSASSLQRIAGHLKVPPDVLLFGDQAPSVLRRREAMRLLEALRIGGYAPADDLTPAQINAIQSAAAILCRVF